MDIQNHFYGHSGVLAGYTGHRRLRHINGLVQHGWVVTSPLVSNFGDFAHVGARPGDSRRLFVWSHSSRAWSPDRDAEPRTTTPIGAQFLYLLRSPRFQASTLDAALPQDQRKPLVVPMHGTHVTRIDSDPAALSDFYREALGPSTVCLHSEDIKQRGIVEAWQAGGHEVVSAGNRFDPLFLPRIGLGVQRASRVVSNRLSTVIWYAAAAGTPASVFGPVSRIAGEPDDALERLVQTWPEVHAEDAPLSVVAGVAAGELGAQYVRTPDELNRLLGWKAPVSAHAFLDYWAGGPVAKALAVLGLRQRAGTASPAGNPAAHTGAPAPGPKASDFLHNPLSHLPRRLPQPPAPGAAIEWVRP